MIKIVKEARIQKKELLANMMPSDKFLLGDVLFVIVSKMTRRILVTDIQDGTNCTFPPEMTVQPVIVNFHVEEIEADE